MTKHANGNSQKASHHFKTTILYDESSEKDRLDFQADIVAGLQSIPKRIPGKYVYDDLGSGKCFCLVALIDYLTSELLSIL